MRAAVIRAAGDADALRIEDVPVPALRANDVLIRVAACGVCFHDVVTRNGVLRRGISMPLIPGHEASAVSVATHYAGLLDGFVLDEQDAALRPRLGLPSIAVQTVMHSLEDRAALARATLDFARTLPVGPRLRRAS